MSGIVSGFFGLCPVFAFLIALIVFDSYKLVKSRSVLQATIVGCFAAAISLFLNGLLSDLLHLPLLPYSRYVAPLVEETLKAVFIVYLVKFHKIGFIVDAAIFGFALGAGFAAIENIYYLNTLKNTSVLLWFVRGFGTAAMHGGTTAIFAMISKNLADHRSSLSIKAFLPGLALAILLHSVFNHFVLPPLATTILILILFPLLIFIVFERSEKSTQEWLGTGFDADMELLDLIMKGEVSQTRIGVYLDALRRRFDGPIVAEMLCLLRIHLELAMRAKATMMLRKAGFKTTIDEEIKEKLAELEFLEKSVGTTGKLALMPLIKKSSRDIWQLQMLNTKS